MAAGMKTLGHNFAGDGLKEDILSQIEQGLIRPHQPIMPEAKLAEKYGISYMTVRKVTDALVAKGILYRIQGKGTFIAERKLRNIGFVFHKGGDIDSPGPYFLPIMEGIEKRCSEGKCNLLFTIPELQAEASDFQERLLDGDVQGIISLGSVTEKFLLAVENIGLPLVLIDPARNVDNFDCVVPDNFNGAYQIAKHLLQTGYKRIGFISSFFYALASTQRLKGYKEALREVGIPYDKQLSVKAKGPFDRGKSAVKSLLKLNNPPQAVVASTDLIAKSAIEGIKEMGLKIPDDIAVVGFDDIAEAEKMEPPLTTVRIPKKEMGEKGFERLLELAGNGKQDPKRIIMPVEVVIRESCGSKLRRIT